MIEFKYQYEKSSPKINVALFPDSTLDQVIEAFEGFLRAAGYSFDGHVMIELDEVNNENSSI